MPKKNKKINVKFFDNTNEVEKAANEKNKKKRKRIQVKGVRLSILISYFDDDPKPSKHTKQALSKQLGIPLKTIQIWFQNRRAKGRNVETDNEEYPSCSQDTVVGLNSSIEVPISQDMFKAGKKIDFGGAFPTPASFIDSADPTSAFFANPEDDNSFYPTEFKFLTEEQYKEDPMNKKPFE